MFNLAGQRGSVGGDATTWARDIGNLVDFGEECNYRASVRAALAIDMVTVVKETINFGYGDTSFIAAGRLLRRCCVAAPSLLRRCFCSCRRSDAAPSLLRRCSIASVAHAIVGLLLHRGRVAAVLE